MCEVFMHGKETQNPLLAPFSKEDEGFVGKVKMSSSLCVCWLSTLYLENSFDTFWTYTWK